MDDEKISLRISKEELQVLDLYLEEHPECGSRSHFIKNAIRASLDRDAQIVVGKKDTGAVKGDCSEFVVKLPSALQASVESVIATGYYETPGEYVRHLIRLQFDADGSKARAVAECAAIAATSGISP